ncbi:hypothetical protein FHS20_001249 [Phyllobacterium endophyticum]|nr:hypothetical protein [Phyllobacterium endophyticum]
MNDNHNDTVSPLSVVLGICLALFAIAWMIVPLFFIGGI